MLKLTVKWLAFALAIVAICYYLPGIEVENFWMAMIVAAVITIVNIFVKPLVKLLAFPINLFTFGLFNLIINLGMLYLVAWLIPQFELNNFVSAFIASIIIAIAYLILKKI